MYATLDSTPSTLPSSPSTPVSDDATRHLKLPTSLQDIRSYLHTLDPDYSFSMYASNECLGAQIVREMNPEANEVRFGHYDCDLWYPDGQMINSVHLIGAAGDFFGWLFAHTGGSDHSPWRGSEIGPLEYEMRLHGKMRWTARELLSEVEHFALRYGK